MDKMETEIMRTSRQVRNKILRDLGIFPGASYHVRVRLGDRVVARIVEDDPPVDRTLFGFVREIREHGWYVDIRLYVPATHDWLWVTLYREGPPDWGCVECRVVERVALGQ